MEIVFRSGQADALWRPALRPVYLLYGEEDRLKAEAVEALTRRVVAPDSADFDLEILDAARVTADQIGAAAGQAPFGSERRMVLIKGMELWRERARQSDAEQLAEEVARLGDTVCLVLVVAAQDEEARRKTAVTVKLDNAVKKVGALVACRALRGNGLADWVVARARQEGKQLAPEAADLLIQAVGSEMLLLEQEICKLACYVGDAESITVRDVGRAVATNPEDVMFTTIDAIVRRQTDRALMLLGELHRYDPKPQAVAGRLLSLLARQYRLLWQAKFLLEKRVHPRDVRALPSELAAELPGEFSITQPNVAFRVGELFGQAKTISWPDLTGAFTLLLWCDLANKGGATEETDLFGADPVSNLQLLVLRLTGATNPRSIDGAGR